MLSHSLVFFTNERIEIQENGKMIIAGTFSFHVGEEHHYWQRALTTLTKNTPKVVLI